MSHLRVVPEPVPPSMFDGCRYSLTVIGFVLAPWAVVAGVGWGLWRYLK